MATHNHNYTYKKTSTCVPLAKEGDDVVCTETVKHYYNAQGLASLEAEQNSNKAAMTAYDAAAGIKEADDILAEIAAVQ